MGFGIGAFEARSLVAAMGGRLEVESREGEGTRFTLLLPAAEDGAAPQRTKMTRMNAPFKPRLLIVEDDEGLQRQLRWAYDDYEVLVASDREAAINLLRAEEPAVVTLDLGLPPDPDGSPRASRRSRRSCAEARDQGDRRLRPRRARERAQGDRLRRL
jgi:hypothetical protein